MKSVILKKQSKNSYFPEPTNYYGMEILAYWFAHDVGDWIVSWREWLMNDEYEDTESNASWLEKCWPQPNRCEIIFGSLTDMIVQTRKGVYAPKKEDTVSIPLTNVIELLNIWEQLLKTRPEQIIITEENGVYKMFAVH